VQGMRASIAWVGVSGFTRAAAYMDSFDVVQCPAVCPRCQKDAARGIMAEIKRAANDDIGSPGFSNRISVATMTSRNFRFTN